MNQITQRIFQIRLLTAMLLMACGVAAHAAPLALSNTPLYVSTGTKANVLLIFGNANNMDEDPTGLAVGSANPASKSEIARTAARSLVSNYTGQINMGLMAFQQNPFNSSPIANNNNYTIPQWLSQSPYDASYDPANYWDPAAHGGALFSGARNSTTKAYRVPNPTSPNASGACTTAGGVKVDCVYYNVNLPFYSSGPQGNTFCYSSSASAFNNGETYPGGPWDNYRCFSTMTGTSDTLPATPGSNSNASITTDETAAGYGSYINTYSFYPTDSDLAQNILDFGTRMVSFDVGPAWFSNRSPGLGYLHVPVANLDTTQAGKLGLKLATSVVPTYSSGGYNTNPTSISGGNNPTNPNAPLQNAGLSPITGTFMTAQDYYNGATGSFGSSQGGPQADPPDSCGNDFVVFLTNGLPNVSSTGAAVSYNGTQPYSPTEVSNAVTAVSNLKSASRPVGTYVIGFALPKFTADYFTANPPNPLDQMAAAGTTTAMTNAGATGKAYYANNLTQLNATFSSIFNNILAQSGSAAAVALTSGSVVAGSRIFQGQFNSADWSGDLVAFNINATTGAVIKTPTAWNAALQVNAQNYDTGRNIITYKPSNSLGAQGIPFRWPANPLSPSTTELDPVEVSALDTTPGGATDTNGGVRLDYVRGSAANEGTGATNYRPRKISKLGDIVDSAPFYVAAPASNYSDSLESAPYSTFRSTYLNRTPMIYVGANDGMLHGFDAGTGNEKLAYVPSPVYSNLTQLTSPTYSHRYFVDGSPTVLDGFYGGAWHTVLVSGLAGGGQGFFALDVTDPSTFSEANASSLVRWEFTDKDDADMGFSFSQPSIVKLNDSAGTWAAIFGNGYNNTAADGNASTTGHAVLYIVNLETGALIKKIDTKYGSTTTPNGLATPTAIDTDGNSTADTVYAGDLAGNMWKFDISNSNPAQWKSAFVSGSTPVPLFVAKDSGGARQPITAAPDVSVHPLGSTYGYMVMFGTGKYLESGDPSNISSQTFYGVQDNGVAIAGRSALVQQTITSTSLIGGKTYRSLSANTVNWTGSPADQGWYLDLPSSGERVVSESSTDSGRVIFTTMIPSTGTCSAGGSGWLMEVSLSTGGALGAPTFDVNGDGVIDSSDYVGSPGSYAGGVAVDAIPSAVRLQKNAGGNPPGPPPSLLKRLSLSNKTIATIQNTLSPTVGRTSWRQIIQ
ncbi:MAG: pilus assembly protein [Sulfuriferula sp.]